MVSISLSWTTSRTKEQEGELSIQQNTMPSKFERNVQVTAKKCCWSLRVGCRPWSEALLHRMDDTTGICAINRLLSLIKFENHSNTIRQRTYHSTLRRSPLNSSEPRFEKLLDEHTNAISIYLNPISLLMTYKCIQPDTGLRCNQYMKCSVPDWPQSHKIAEVS